MADLPAPASPAGQAALSDFVEAAEKYANASRAEATRRGYATSLRDFRTWGGQIPTSGDDLAAYLIDRAESGTSVATLAQRLAAIRAAHRETDAPPPDSQAFRSIWAGIRRANGKPPTVKAALQIDDLRRVLAAIPDNLKGKRDRALLLVGFGAALRRSELAALELEGGYGSAVLAFVPEGLEIRLGRSKADQEGRGETIGIPLGSEPLTCATGAVRAWLAAAGIEDGPIWRHVRKNGKLGPPRAITDQVVADVVKTAVKRVGLNPSDFAGHSLRAGLITSAAVNDAPPDVIMRQARHRKFDVTQRYIREATRFTRNAAKIAGL